MALVYPTNFTVYDGRHHVLGASMLAAADAAVRALKPSAPDTPLKIRRAKFTEKASLDGVIAIDDGASALPEGVVVSEIDADFSGQPLRIAVIGDPNRAVQRAARSSHTLTKIVSTSRFAGECMLKAAGRETVLLSLVDACKHVQLADPSFTGRTTVVELLFLEDLAIDNTIDHIAAAVSVQNIGVRDAFGRLVTLSIVRFPDSSGRQRGMRMSLSFRIEGQSIEK